MKKIKWLLIKDLNKIAINNNLNRSLCEDIVEKDLLNNGYELEKVNIPITAEYEHQGDITRLEIIILGTRTFLDVPNIIWDNV